MKNTNQMNGLYPIIRRVRRPLLPTDQPADAKPAPAPRSAEKPSENQTARSEVEKGAGDKET
jgi:hypothetical protein